jgi:serine-type D-Ala-D-Ala carboxypeptidase/endopeptidase
LRFRCVLISVTGVILSGMTGFAQASPPDDMIRRILADRVGSENSGIGLVVGVIDPKGRRVVSYGSLAKNDKRPLNGDTIFEIGSMTKVFTSLVLMDMAQKGEVAVTDPVSKSLPVNVTVPERNGRKITLLDLSTRGFAVAGRNCAREHFRGRGGRPAHPGFYQNARYR